MIITLLTNCLNIYILGALKYAHYIKTCLTIKTDLNLCLRVTEGPRFSIRSRALLLGNSDVL